MIRISLPYVWALAADLDDLERLDASKQMDRIDIALYLSGPTVQLEMLLLNSVFSPNLRTCARLGEVLLGELKKYVEGDWSGEPVKQHELQQLKNLYLQFRIAFIAELGTLPSFFVSQKGSHDTHLLLEQSQRMFPDDLPKKVPEAMFDVAEAGKALCYELATACGYHLFRTLEAVLRRYYTQVTGGRPQPKMRNIGVYIKAIRSAKAGDERILSVVDQIAKLHRNPLIHPEVALTLDEAISILGMVRSAVTAMLAVLPEAPQTTTTIGDQSLT